MCMCVCIYICVCVYICIYIYIYTFLCVFVFQFNFYVDTEDFQLYKFPHVSPPQSICTTLALRTHYMLHPTLSLFCHPQNTLSSANHEPSRRANSTCPPLPRPS